MNEVLTKLSLRILKRSSDTAESITPNAMTALLY